MLYCIEHEEMVGVEYFKKNEFFGHLEYILGNPDLGIMADIDFCEFPLGFAYCPPPEFDMEEFMETVGEQPIDSDFLAYDYDVETDQIVTEVFP